MKRPKPQRNAVSSALVELRKRLGHTQQSFTNEVWKIAISTEARFETSNPPTGDLLLQLAAIAQQHITGKPREEQEALKGLRDRFRAFYLEEVLKKLGIHQGCAMIVMPAAEREQVRAYMVGKLVGPAQVERGQEFLFALLGDRLNAAALPDPLTEDLFPMPRRSKLLGRQPSALSDPEPEKSTS